MEKTKLLEQVRNRIRLMAETYPCPNRNQDTAIAVQYL